jgi:hypothetical protein
MNTNLYDKDTNTIGCVTNGKVEGVTLTN